MIFGKVALKENSFEGNFAKGVMKLKQTLPEIL